MRVGIIKNNTIKITAAVNAQKAIATEVLHMLEITDPNCILAGGAPRDWWMGNVASDLDFYVYWGENTTCGEDKLRLKRLGFTGPKHSARGDFALNYGTMTDLKRVWEFCYKGETIQVMVMTKPTFSCVVDRFGISSSKVWWKGNGIQVTVDFLISHVYQILFLKDDYNAGENYVKKIMGKFPEYTTRDYKYIQVARNKFEDETQSPWWKMLHLGENQNYETVMKLFKGE